MSNIYDLALNDNGKGVLFYRKSFIHGNGLFTSAALPWGTILCRRLGLRENLSFRDKRAILGVDGLDRCAPEDDIFQHVNHSCNPNAFLSDTGCLITSIYVNPDTEITVSYSTVLVGSTWQMNCQCAEANCLKIVSAPIL